MKKKHCEDCGGFSINENEVISLTFGTVSYQDCYNCPMCGDELVEVEAEVDPQESEEETKS